MAVKMICLIMIVAGFILTGTANAENEEEKRLVLHSETDLTSEVIQLKQEFAALQLEIRAQKNASTSIQNELEKQKNLTVTQMLELENQKNVTAVLQLENKQLKATQQLLSQGSGSLYTRWGRNVCPGTTSLVYKGFTAGKHYNVKGSGNNNLCLPAEPTWSKYQAGTNSERGYIYGAEIDTPDSHHIFNYPVNEQDIPCAVCHSNKSSSLMIPGRNNCYGGWTMEYHGYLMAGISGYESYDHICVDGNPEFLQHGGTNDNQHILYLVEGVCGSLPCPPYVNYRELTCVVCSK